VYKIHPKIIGALKIATIGLIALVDYKNNAKAYKTRKNGFW
jgi:hypothetical protein